MPKRTVYIFEKSQEGDWISGMADVDVEMPDAVQYIYIRWCWLAFHREQKTKKIKDITMSTVNFFIKNFFY